MRACALDAVAPPRYVLCVVTLTTEQARTALDALGWDVTERDGELYAEHRRGALPMSSCARHNPDWAWSNLLNAALNVHRGLV